jgi:hypothetical protein
MKSLSVVDLAIKNFREDLQGTANQIAPGYQPEKQHPRSRNKGTFMVIDAWRLEEYDKMYGCHY